MNCDYITFNKLFNSFQKKSRTVNNYFDFEAFKDMKVILASYVSLYDNRAYKYYDLDSDKIKKMLSSFDCYKKKELLSFFIKRLVLQGNNNKAQEFIRLLNEVEIKCSLNDLTKGKNIGQNIIKLTHKTSAYNIFTLIMSLAIIICFSLLIFMPAPFECMEIIEANKKNISSSNFYNDICNLLLYIFDMDSKMDVKPLNAKGVFLLVSLKTMFIVIIANYLVRELFDKLKIS